MKKLILIALPIVGMTLFGCENYKEQAAQLTRERDSLVSLNVAGTQTIDEFITTLTDVENSLGKITEKQNSIAMTADRNPEAARNSRERLNAQIEEINRMMQENKEKVEQLTKAQMHLQQNFRKWLSRFRSSLLKKNRNLLC